MSMKEPVHPGAFVREMVLEHHGLSITRAAQILGVGRQALSALVNGRASMSPEMATRFEKAFGISRELLLRMQLAYDLAKLRDLDERIEVERFDPHAA
jgi:addiction module HigA family antidote